MKGFAIIARWLRHLEGQRDFRRWARAYARQLGKDVSRMSGKQIDAWALEMWNYMSERGLTIENGDYGTLYLHGRPPIRYDIDRSGARQWQ